MMYKIIRNLLSIDLIVVFDVILTGGQNDKELRCLNGNPMDTNFLGENSVNFTQFVNRNVKILDKRLYSPSLKDVAWPEESQPRIRSQIYRQMYGKLDKLAERLLAKLHHSN